MLWRKNRQLRSEKSNGPLILLGAGLAEQRKPKKPIVSSVLLIVDEPTRLTPDRGKMLIPQRETSRYVIFNACHSIKRTKTFLNVIW